MYSRIITALVVLVIPLPTIAYSVLNHNLTTPYEVFMIEAQNEQAQLVTGELEGYPEMVEFTVTETGALSVSLLTLPGSTTPDYSGIVVRVLAPRGVEEVARLKTAEATWGAWREPVSKIMLRQGPTWSAEVASGTYRVEVSTPENYGKYVVMIGTDTKTLSYGDTWEAVSSLYTFAGVSKVGMIRTSLVYMPLLILLILGGFLYTLYRTRHQVPLLKKIFHA